MKKLIFLLTVIISVSTHAQKRQFGFTAGTTIANYKAKSDGNNETLNSKAGFTLGVIANFAAGKRFVIQPAINWVQKGTQDKQTFIGVTEKVTLITNHIEVPLNFMYSSNGFFIGAGPSFSFGVSGKVKAESGGTKTAEKVKFGNGDDDMLKTFDLGANVLAGYQLKNGLLIAANYNLGLNNLAAGTDPSKGTLKSSYFGIKLGYVINNAGNK